jgi:hypothetical protein
MSICPLLSPLMLLHLTRPARLLELVTPRNMLLSLRIFESFVVFSQVVGDQIYVYGGWNGKKYLNYGFLYSVDKMNMLLEKNKDRVVPTARRDHSITLVNNKMFLFGGWNCVEQFSDLWVLNDGKLLIARVLF